ncbi:cation/acetate symporter [Malonomonas rubra DSM 5091]|uniref:Cation/acetate symporter n=1 Tax=Malonomonas rubra DSM 5091 TaxID=1122189 RepID=A0A1M6F070_MALRU|nr:cation acetate symporter [Malonomonas rubra]SHI91055.1 cation/acetate symporter [Malonomonas rubra DSM 5091]
MVYTQSPIAIGLFFTFVIFVLGLSFYLARRTSSAEGYYAAGGNIHWFTNGVAFAGDYLSAASFLGICGMIATAGYDGWMYSIGYLAGWIVALFLVAEPMKRLGKYTFTDALDSKFNSKAIQLAAAISTLLVSVFYLIPQMVGAGVLVQPLLGLPHWVGVCIVGVVVTIIVATAGMASTTYVQFFKGALLLIMSTVVVIAVLMRGLTTAPENNGAAYHDFKTMQATAALELSEPGYTVVAGLDSEFGKAGFVKLSKAGEESIWQLNQTASGYTLEETLYMTKMADGTKKFNGAAKEEGKFFPVGHIKQLKVDGQEVAATGAVGPFAYLSALKDSTIVLWGKKYIQEGDATHTIYYQKPTPGSRVLRPGLKFKVDNATGLQKFNFISLMLALFCGTAALPHILIRYYTVPSQAAARKSTIVAIAAIGFFYVLTLFLGMGAMTNGVINLTDNNMSAPLLALSFGVVLFAVISSLAFATVLGTVSGLIVAASGAVAHDIMDNFLGMKMSDAGKVRAGKISAIVVGCIAIYLGIVFEGMNVSFLVGWAFAVAASANLPAILMLLFWKKTTAKGIAASVLVGLISSLGLILISPDMWVRYGLLPGDAPIQFNSPALISIPASFLALVIVSMMTQKDVPVDATETAGA